MGVMDVIGQTCLAKCLCVCECDNSSLSCAAPSSLCLCNILISECVNFGGE